MAEETPAATPDAPAPEPGGEQARQFFEKAAEKAGIPDPSPAPESPAGGVRTRETPTRDPKDATAPEPDLDRAHAEYGRRRAEVHKQRREEAAAAVLDRVARKLEAEAQQAPAAGVSEEAAADAGNPFDKETDYWNWEEWNREALKKGLLSEMRTMLAPVLSAFEQQQQRAAAEQQRAEQQRAEDEWRREMAGIARDAHETYQSTPQGQGYMERVTWLVGHGGDEARGIKPVDGALTLGFMAAFPRLPEAEARTMARRHVDGMMAVAQRYNQMFPDNPVNPAAAMDAFTRVQIAAALDAYGPGRAGGNGAAAAQPAAPARQAAPSAAQARSESLKAAAASAVAGSVAEGGTKGGGDLMGELRRGLASGTLGVEEMRQLAIRFYGNANRQNLMKLSKVSQQVAEELRQSA